MQHTYIALDLETTGLSATKDRILEIGAVMVENGEVTGTYETFVDNGVEIPERIRELTGITEDMVAGSPEMKPAVEGFLAFSGEKPLLGHNILFDYGFMKRNVQNIGGSYERDGIDTLMIARACLPQLPSRSLDKVAEYFGIEFGEQQAALFAPSPLCFHVKKESAITNSQKGYLRDLLKYHRIESNVKIDTLTKSEASRMIDGIILQYGKIIRR